MIMFGWFDLFLLADIVFLSTSLVLISNDLGHVLLKSSYPRETLKTQNNFITHKHKICTYV